MRMRYHQSPGLPRLAWLCEVRRSSHEVSVHLGSWVERTDRFFVEGVWNGAFETPDFHRTEGFFGSGVLAQDDRLVIVPSAATTDSVYYKIADGKTTVSNSLPFLLARLDDALDPNCRTYDRQNDSILAGINRYEREIVTLRGGVRRLLFRNLVVDESGASEVDKPMPAPFPRYHDYCAYLDRNYALLAANARDGRRGCPMHIFSTQSRGYDTTAVNAIACRYGIDKVFTCTRAKGKNAFADKDILTQLNDDGTDIALHLGITCIPINRRRWESGFDNEYLYHAVQHANQDANLLEVNEHVERPTLVLTGILGELWYTPEQHVGERADSVDPELKKWDLGGHGLSEVRLQVGFVQLPLPYFGAQRREDIFRITQSEEMRPWRLDSGYDRPIARRIAEERGVPRHLFGQQKMASVVEFVRPRIPYSQDLREEYFDFLVANKLLARWEVGLFPLVHRFNEAIVLHGAARYLAERAVSRLTGREARIHHIWRRLNGSVYCFAVNKRTRDYKETLAASDCPSDERA